MLYAEWSLDSLSQLSLGTGVIAIIALCAVVCLVRGIIRLMINTVIIAAAGLAAYFTWQHAPGWSHDYLGQDVPWLATALPIAAFVAVWLGLKTALNLLSHPFSSGEGKGSGGLGKLALLLISLCPAALLSLGGAAALHHAGSVAEVENFANKISREAEPFQSKLLAKMKETISQYLPNELLGAVDPNSDQARLTLAKLLIASSDQKKEEIPRALPVMEEPEIRDLVLKDPHLRQLAKNKRYAEILNDPRLDHVLQNDELKRLLTGVKL